MAGLGHGTRGCRQGVKVLPLEQWLKAESVPKRSFTLALGYVSRFEQTQTGDRPGHRMEGDRKQENRKSNAQRRGRGRA